MDNEHAVLSKFGYAYNAIGDVATWTQQTDSSTTNSYAFTYDLVDRLLGATLENASTL